LSLSSSIVRDSSMVCSSRLAACSKIRPFLAVRLSKILSRRVRRYVAISEILKMVNLVVTGWPSVSRMGEGS
jgi:hypothetical protein